MGKRRGGGNRIFRYASNKVNIPWAHFRILGFVWEVGCWGKGRSMLRRSGASLFDISLFVRIAAANRPPGLGTFSFVRVKIV